MNQNEMVIYLRDLADRLQQGEMTLDGGVLNTWQETGDATTAGDFPNNVRMLTGNVGYTLTVKFRTARAPSLR